MTGRVLRSGSTAHFHQRVSGAPASIRTVSSPRPAAVADLRLVMRVRGEFCEMRGFSPTVEQAARLFQLPMEECRRILAALRREGFLQETEDGRFRLGLVGGVMTRIVSLAATFMLIAGWAAAQDAVQKGQQVYADQKCSICHSIGDKGNKKGPLDGVGARLSPDEVRQWMVNAPEMTVKTKSPRKPAMKSYPNLSKADLDALVAYVASLKK